MAKQKKTSFKQSKKDRFKTIKLFFTNRQTHVVFGSFLLILAVFLITALISYLSSWKIDQSTLHSFADRGVSTHNLLGKLGAISAHFFVYSGFGVASFYIPVLLLLSGLCLLLNIPFKRISKPWFWGVLSMAWYSLLFGFALPNKPLLGGVVGFEINAYLNVYIGRVGIALLLIFCVIIYIAVRFKLTPEHISGFIKSKKKQTKKAFQEAIVAQQETENKVAFSEKLETPNIVDQPQKDTTPLKSETVVLEQFEVKKESKSTKELEVAIEIEKPKDEDTLVENLSDKLLKDFGRFDPTLELAKYKFPALDLLFEYENESIKVDQEELEINKNRIVETLSNYKIGIASIKATIGPTVTLYEIVPDAGIRISKIKNLEDDIALSLKALGIRIIAPIPGKGTIGIEVPNKKPTIVSMRSVLASQKFQKAQMELPIALGKTISNETFVCDLAKMPHLLMAGATGQGKSVGLNAILASLLYKKHPAEVKFVLVDPKKVELTLFNKIERHYLAKLPDTEDAIITDTTKVINTLNSLCIEMDARYDLLKNAFVRNIKEYNQKFKDRKLNPENGHRFLPYIILVIDEFADLIMTAGKEIETPIARLAQLARAIGIHLIVATQRPSVNVITGIIKANFPARIAFRVTSKIDSRTILDAQGADQLIGKGDMLIAVGSDLTRLQCAFVDTPEIDKITEFIGSQRAYPEAYMLPEYSGEESISNFDIDIDDRDLLFRDAAKVIINAQQGSASLLQRKLKLGYNRAGRLIDQLEAAGIVGPFEGSKARQVLVPDEMALNELLKNEKNL
ncbi:MAG: DNA translocase FtsK [Flavobacteriaceae bacterium]|nr:DNA translocase FtsK [Flavobacteriaceae bacterium]